MLPVALRFAIVFSCIATSYFRDNRGHSQNFAAITRRCLVHGIIWPPIRGIAILSSHPISPGGIVFILVRPSEAGNVGATVRVMKNFGFAELRVVSPQIDFREMEDRWMAVGAYDLIEKCQEFSSLTDAVHDVSFVIGTTSARFRAVKPSPFESVCKEAVYRSPTSKVAFVFGNERNGLTFDELERCHSTSCIETNPEFPVLNVAQSVALVAYECARSSRTTTGAGQEEPQPMPVGTDEDTLFSLVDDLIKKVQFSRDFNHAQILRELRSAYQRIRPTTREFGLLNGLVHRLLDRLPGKDG